MSDRKPISAASSTWFAGKTRRFWVVSPNVRNHNPSVSEWRQVSVKYRAAFMGYSPDDTKHKRIGFKFAHVIRPNDVVLIARRHRKKPEIVGFGVVIGRFRKTLKGLATPQSFGALRTLSPFIPLSEAPPKLPLTHALGQTTALRRLYPHKNAAHGAICRWMEQMLARVGSRKTHQRSLRHEPETRLTNLPHEHELEYQVRTRRRVLRAKKIEANLVCAYREWLQRQKRSLFVARYRSTLRCDAYEKARNNLIEAKCSAHREYIRMAVGQLLEYEYLGRESLGPLNKAILLPERPAFDSIGWLTQLSISIVWKEGDVFLDNANGQFS